MKLHSAQRPLAKKSLGQNFLVDQDVIDRILNAVGPTETNLIIEIGPGAGALTKSLVDSDASVIALELDRELIPLLREKFESEPNFRLIEADALEVEFCEIVASSNIGTRLPAPANDADSALTYVRDSAFELPDAGGSDRAKLVANLPYYISTAILQRLAEQRECFSTLVLMFQREVVERITAEPGNSERGFLTVLVEAAFSVEKLFDVPPTAFRPVPKVWSSVVRLTPKPKSFADEPQFRELISTAFAQKRKTILNNMKHLRPNAAESLKKANIAANRRAETLSLDEWIALYSLLSRN
ncbi:MAG: ribosomal RNA small subunit methyltransferase A [Pyrinomonadaceae bacterium]